MTDHNRRLVLLIVVALGTVAAGFGLGYGSGVNHAGHADSTEAQVEIVEPAPEMCRERVIVQGAAGKWDCPPGTHAQIEHQPGACNTTAITIRCACPEDK